MAIVGKARDSDVILITTPTSGTTWLKATGFTFINQMQYPIAPDHPLPSKNPYDLEEVVAQEFKDLIFSLPKENGWVASYLYKYQGFWHPVRHLQGIITCQRHFQARDSDVILITTPKLGTTRLKVIVFTLMNRMQYPIAQDHPLHSKNPHDLVPFLEHTLYVDNQIPDLSSMNSPRLLATHLSFISIPRNLFRIPDIKSTTLVYLCRNPKDTFVSLWQFCNRLRPKEMGTHSLGEAFECSVLFLKYDDMKENPTVNLRRIAEFLECPFSNEEEESGMVEEILKLCSLGNLSNLEINRTGKLSSGEENKVFFRQGKVGDWKNHLTIDMVEKLDKITDQKLSGSRLVL
ncbi:cytosolic sulfotransferase 12-like [Olea europaea subsp. europaea]|uniref:Sulfotransferase n=1 Tax=Olea europaea subsp. europaea TaxID=158383 RepID=A0A8S0PY20_OLEEU|nr:cytosolic sulfotransferase 12-like [Olea europaea subsp. europaea]